MPMALLEGLFMKITPSVLALDALNGVVSTAAPFAILRSVAPAHHAVDKSAKHFVRNRPILTDTYTTAATSILAATIFAVLLEISFATFLPEFLVSHFEHISTLEPAHSGPAQLPILVLGLLPAGLACTSYLFAPSTAAPIKDRVEMDTQTAGFLDHVKWNLWGWYTSRQQELIKRAFVMATLMSTEILVQCLASLDGVDPLGAAGYTGIWTTGVALLTLALDWIGKPSD
jgi:hypothetical protein